MKQERNLLACLVAHVICVYSSNMCLLIVLVGIVMLDWKSQKADDGLQQCYLVDRCLNATQNQTLPQIFASKLLIKSQCIVFENRHNITKQNINISLHSAIT